jgi:hypothetical protein
VLLSRLHDSDLTTQAMAVQGGANVALMGVHSNPAAEKDAVRPVKKQQEQSPSVFGRGAYFLGKVELRGHSL